MEIVNQYSIYTILIISIIGFIGRSVFKAFVEAGLESYKKELNMELEALKQENLVLTSKFESDLKLLHEKQIKLYEFRLERINEFYINLNEFNLAMDELTLPFKLIPANASKEELQKIEKEKIDKSAILGNTFLKSYLNIKIYLPKEICLLIEDLNLQFKKAHSDYKYTQIGNDNQLKWESQLNSYDIVKQKVPPIVELIDTHLRNLFTV